MRNWEPIIAKSDEIWTWTGRPELTYLCELASRSSFGVEFGVYMGRSSRVMLDASFHQLHLWVVDPFMVAGTYEVTKHFLKPYLEAGTCEIIRKGSREASEQLAHMARKLDFVFIDDGHAYADVILDITCWLPLVRNGGILCGHDYDTNPDNEVTKAVKELLPGHTQPVPRLWEYIKP